MSIQVTWVAPTKRKSGRPLKAGDLVGLKLSMKVEGAPSFTQIAVPAPTDTSYTVDVTDPGLYEFELVALAFTAGQSSTPVTGAIEIDDTSPLEAPTAFTVALV